MSESRTRILEALESQSPILDWVIQLVPEGVKRTADPPGPPDVKVRLNFRGTEAEAMREAHRLFAASDAYVVDVILLVVCSDYGEVDRYYFSGTAYLEPPGVAQEEFIETMMQDAGGEPMDAVPF